MASDPAGDSAQLRIDAVAQRTGLTKRTIRYYEEYGLITPSGRSEGGYRLYTEDDVVDLERIQRLRDSAGLSLSEIRELLDAYSVRDRIRRRYRETDDPGERLALIAESIQVLTRQLQLIGSKRQALDALHSEYAERLATLRTMVDELQARRVAS